MRTALHCKTMTPRVERWHLQNWLRIQTNAKPKVYREVLATAEIDNLRYWPEVIFSAGIATFGLVESSQAVTIGAMLISPLIGPIIATGLALAIGDGYLGIKAVLNLVVSTPGLAVTVSLCNERNPSAYQA